MKRFLLITTLVLVNSIMMNILKVYADETPFKIIYPNLSYSNINISYNSTDTLDLSDIDCAINGFSLDCEIIRLQNNSFARVILEDATGKNYLVLENDKYRNNGDTVKYHGYCEESASLNNIYPKYLKLYLKDAVLKLNSIKYSTTSENSQVDYVSDFSNSDTLKKRQITEIVNNINRYNKEHNKLWIAGITNVSLMDYESKKRVLGIKNDGYDTEGYEYYIDGIFEIGEPDTKDNGVSTNEIEMYSPYVESFDWRNRHGINWMTSCKDQGQSGYCVAFAITGALEAISNIYYNNKIDLDLSEQDIVYTYAKQHFIDTISEYYKKGMLEPTALQGVKSVGVVDEMSVPFIDSPNITVSPQRGDYKECLFFNRYDDVNYYQQINNIKYDLINFGPMVGGINAGETRHAMTLVGYHKIKVGDTITNVTTEYEGAGIIREGDRRIGQTYWVFKNSYGENFGRRGYMYVLFADMSKMSKPYYIMTPLQSEQYSDNDIICSDKDGDGYYFWGFGTKPSHLPKWIPKSRDGDDSNAKYGPMNSYG